MGLFKRVGRAWQRSWGTGGEGPGHRITGTTAGPQKWADEGFWVGVSPSSNGAHNTWVTGLRYSIKDGWLYVRFEDGVICVYPGVSVEEAEQIYRSGSPSKYVRHNMSGRPYAIAIGTFYRE